MEIVNVLCITMWIVSVVATLVNIVAFMAKLSARNYGIFGIVSGMIMALVWSTMRVEGKLYYIGLIPIIITLVTGFIFFAIGIMRIER